MRSLVKASFALAFLAACGPQEMELDVDVVDETDVVEGEVTIPEAVIRFHDGNNTSLSAPLIEGGKFRVSYDANRLPQCRGEQNGQPAWSITGYYSLNGGEVKSFEAGGYSPSQGTAPQVFSLPASGDLSLWFQVTGRWGCSAWDSKLGANHHFAVWKKPAVAFKSDWTTQVDGTPGSTSQLTVNYDLSRLPSCRQVVSGAPTWNTTMYYRFDGGTVRSKSVTKLAGNTRKAAPAVLTIPTGAASVEVWFKNFDRSGCVGWDSQFGQNYSFRLR